MACPKFVTPKSEKLYTKKYALNKYVQILYAKICSVINECERVTRLLLTITITFTIYTQIMMCSTDG